MLTLLAAAALAAPQPGLLKTFGDWTVGCDNGLACQAVALVPETTDRDAYLLLVIERAGRGAPVKLSFPLLDTVPPGTPYTLSVDGRVVTRATAQGKPPENAADAELTIAPRELAILRDGKRAALQGTPVSASLTGLAAALLYMDEQQRRAVPALPTLIQPASSSKAPRTVKPARALAALGPEAKDCDAPTVDLKPEAVRLDTAHSLVLIEHPCGNGAYNLFSTALIVDERGRVTTPRFDKVPSMGADAGLSLVNAGWEPATRTLDTYAKGRGLGDCGVTQSYAWDGARFRLARQAEMGECRGSTDYITTWRTRVITGR